MWRRTVLTAIGASAVPLAGCSGRDGPGTGDTATERPPTGTPGSTDETSVTPTEEPVESGIPRTVTLEELSDEPLRERLGAEARVGVPEPRVTEAHTAQVRVTIGSAAGEPRTLTYTRERCDLDLIAGEYRENGSDRLLLVSSEQAWDRTEPDCWVPDGRNLNCGIPAMEHRITVAPDDPHEVTYRLWVDPETREAGGCMPAGDYRFERVFRLDGTEASLSFALSVATE